MSNLFKTCFLVAAFVAVAPMALAQTTSPAPATQKTQPLAPPAAPRTDTRDLNNNQDSQRYAVRITGDNVRFRLSVNGIPLFSKIMYSGQVLDETFNEYMKVGINTVEIQLERFSSAMASAAKYEVYFQSPSQAVTGEKTMLYASPESIPMPLRHPLGVRVKTIPPLRIWKAERLTLLPAEQSRLLMSINALRTRFIEALERNDNAYLATHDKPIRDEINIAYGRVPETPDDIVALRKKIAKSLSELVNVPVESTPILTADDLVFTPVADGRLMQVTRVDGSPVMHIKRGPIEITVQSPLYGLVAGVWERVR